MPVTPPEDDALDIVDDLRAAGAPAHSWRVLVVDDEPDLVQATLFALRDERIDGRPLSLLTAGTAAEAELLIQADAEIAVLLLDVVMETPDAGLRLVERVRALPGRQALRIILRTGQAGYAPELEVIRRYDINDYKTKAELTQLRLLTCLTVAIRGFHQLRRIESHQRGLEKVVRASGRLMSERGSLQAFADGVLTQICTIVDGQPDGVLVLRLGAGSGERAIAEVVAGAGAFARLVGLPAEALPEPLRGALAHINGADVSHHGGYGVVRAHAQDGDALLVLFSLSSPMDEVATGLLELFAANLSLAYDDVKAYIELQHRAHHDRETGLANRAGLKARLGSATGLEFAQVAVGDLQEIRGVLGEAVARRALQDLALRLQQVLGGQAQVARLEGDRFALAMPGPVTDALVQRLLAALAQPLNVGDMALQLPMALGWSRGGTSVDQAIDEAGLMVARQAPGRQVRSASFSAAVREQVHRRMTLLADLDAALAEDRIEMYLQPQVRLADQNSVGAEALVRWRTREGAIVMPDRFIAVAEHTGAIVQIGERMVEKALAHLASWPDARLRISVNLSLRQLEEPDFAAWVTAQCDAHGVARERLRLEITETAFAVHSEQVGPALAALTEAGFELSIDDFGTGQSSLGRLAEIAVHELKLDRSLVRGIEHDARARRVAGLIVELGRDLGVEVLAEGIETEGQLAVLQQLGCVLGQGWLFGRAQPATQFRAQA
ncbi:putative bifunctional diguanylate cyclase/phosphodiesterase [Paucibacter soli]|uniref:putative bifunctional diguanylate cyclase/phosphodiesterase n=1 Tax=Paucibacter soli TaxID=3133433 RepID=UPI0030A61C96